MVEGNDAVSTFNPADELRRLISDRCLSEEALQAMTGIGADELATFLRTAPAGTPGMSALPPALSQDKVTRLAALSAQLTTGFEIDDDERLKAIFESLTIECHLTLANISSLTGLGVVDLENAAREPRSISAESKYELALRGSYLINAINQARER